MIYTINKKALLEEASKQFFVPVKGNIGSLVWNPNIKKNIPAANIWQLQHANEHNPTELKGLHFDPNTGEFKDNKKLIEFFMRYR